MRNITTLAAHFSSLAKPHFDAVATEMLLLFITERASLRQTHSGQTFLAVEGSWWMWGQFQKQYLVKVDLARTRSK